MALERTIVSWLTVHNNKEARTAETMDPLVPLVAAFNLRNLRTISFARGTELTIDLTPVWVINLNGQLPSRATELFIPLGRDW